MKKAILVALALSGAGLLALAVRSTVLGGQRATPPGEAVRVTRRDLGSVVKATGVVKLRVGAEVKVGVQATGTLKRIRVGIGDRVQRGQLLAELEPGKLNARRQRAAAAVLSAQATLRFAAADLGRKRALIAAGAIPRTDLELSERTSALAEAALEEARAGLALARAELSEARILAPQAGVVASIGMQQGETVAAALTAPVLLTLIDTEQLEVWAYVDETDIGRVRIGQQARFTVDAYPIDEVEGRVEAIYPRPEIRDNVVNYVAAVRFPPPRQRTLRPEMTASVKITLEARPRALTIPRRALRRDQGRSVVICRRGDAVTRREVTTGSRDETSVEIVSGLTEGEEVLVGDAADAALKAD